MTTAKQISILVNIGADGKYRNYRVIDDVCGLLAEFAKGPREVAAQKIGNKILDSINNIVNHEQEG